MQAFTQLMDELETAASVEEKVAALERYFTEVPAEDAAWALHLLSHKVKRAVKTSRLQEWAGEFSGIPPWLLKECHDASGDLAETLALMLPPNVEKPPALARLMERLPKLARSPEPEQRKLIEQAWRELDARQRVLWHKLITGAFRAGVPRTLLVRALANVAHVPRAVMAHRLAGEWSPTAADFRRLLHTQAESEPAPPYPFQLACALEQVPAELGDAQDWLAECQWEGVRAQLVRRGGQTLLWSREEELLKLPEIIAAGESLPEGTVLDGHLLAEEFSSHARGKGRVRLLSPPAFMAYDLLEHGGEDWRAKPLSKRRQQLEHLLHEFAKNWHTARRQPKPTAQGELFDLMGMPEAGAEAKNPKNVAEPPIRLSPRLELPTWHALAEHQEAARIRRIGGLILKRLDAPYVAGRHKGAWWQWKVEPLHIAAVLIGAQLGRGRHAHRYTNYTLGVWDGDQLAAIARVDSSLPEADVQRVDEFVRAHVTGRFGPVRSVEPKLVFEVAFDWVMESTRHRAGVVLIGARLTRWLEKKSPHEAGKLETLRELASEHRKRRQREEDRY
ncbi:MAG: ATP-dependent DNA ligase [Verrucomicrobiota bacterium]